MGWCQYRCRYGFHEYSHCHLVSMKLILSDGSRGREGLHPPVNLFHFQKLCQTRKHSSRMHTACLLTVVGRGCPGGVCTGGGVDGGVTRRDVTRKSVTRGVCLGCDQGVCVRVCPGG